MSRTAANEIFWSQALMQVINYSLIPKVFFNTGYMAVILGPPRLLGLGVLVIAKELAPKKP